MGYKVITENVNNILRQLSKDYLIYAPKVFEGDGRFSDTDTIRYGEISSIEEIVFDKKSEYSFKEILLPISETLFYFTEDNVVVPEGPKKGAIIFLRSCDLHGLKRMDQIYLNNGPEDFYYKRLRENTRFILMGCSHTFDNCFCVDMNSNKSDNYDAYIDVDGDYTYFDCKWDELAALIEKEYHYKTKVLCPLEETDGLIGSQDLKVCGEEEMEEALKDAQIVVADPLYRPICPAECEFYERAHIAFSGRMFLKNK